MSNENERRFKCTSCQAEVVTEIPHGDIINKPTFSALVLTHQEAAVCPGCGQAFAFILRGIKGMEMGWMAISVQKEDSNIIIPPGVVDINSLKTKQ